MNLDKILVDVDTYIRNITTNTQHTNIQLEDLSKLKTVMRKLQQIPLLDNLADKNIADVKLLQKHREANLAYYEHIGDIVMEIERKIDEFKDRYLAFEEITINAYNRFEAIDTNSLIKSLIGLFLPINEVYMISRSTKFKTWGFDKICTDIFLPNNFFEILQHLHADQESDFSLSVWNADMLDNVKPYVKFNNSNKFYGSIYFIHPQSVSVTEANVCMIFGIDTDKVEYIQAFFSDPVFIRFIKQLFFTLYDLCSRLHAKDLYRHDYKILSNRLKRLVGIFSLELFIKRTDELDELNHTIITSKATGTLESEYKILRIENLGVSLIFDNDDTRLDEMKLADLKWNIKSLLDKFVAFFEHSLKSHIDINIKQASDYVIWLDKDQKVLSLETDSNVWSDYIDTNKKFKYNEHLDYYITDERLLAELKKNTTMELQKVKRLENLQFSFEDMQVDIYPLFVLNNVGKDNDAFLVKISKAKVMDFSKLAYDMNAVSNQSFEKPHLQTDDKISNDSKTENNDDGYNDKSQGVRIIVKENLKTPKKVKFLQKQVSSIEEYTAEAQVQTEEKLASLVNLSIKNNSQTNLSRNTNFNKIFLEKGNLDTMFTFFKQKIEEKMKLLKSLEEVENSINETMLMFPVETLKDTIAGEYMQNDDYKPYYQRHKARTSIITNFFSSSGATDPNTEQKPNPILKKESIMKNSFELLDDEKLNNYEINFLEQDSIFIYNAVFTMLYTSGIITQYRMDPMVMYSFLAETEKLYNHNNNRYHNFTHAITVMNTCYYFLKKTPANELFEDIGIAALLFAALMHDVDHKGNNNDYEVKAYTDLALAYNNKSVLENHHAATAFKLLKRVELNIFESLETEDFNIFRTIVIELILMTDPKHHFSHLSKFKKRVQKYTSKEDFKQSKSMDNFILFAGNMVHCADIYGPARPPEQASQWSMLIEQEFLDQLSKEQQNSLPVTKFFQDLHLPRNKILNEIFFVDNIVKPLWVGMNEFLDNALKTQIENIERNSKGWKDKLEALDEVEEKKKKDK